MAKLECLNCKKYFDLETGHHCEKDWRILGGVNENNTNQAVAEDFGILKQGQHHGNSSNLSMHSIPSSSNNMPDFSTVSGSINNMMMKEHLKVPALDHTRKKQYECEVCRKSFGRKQQCQRHMHTHTGKKPFACEVCGKTFIQKGNLQTHMHTHTGEKPFECKVCGKSFIQKGNLQTHMLTHTGAKPHECHFCGEKFSARSNLYRHTKAHKGIKNYKCEICEKTFGRKDYLQKHVLIHMGDKSKDS